MARGMLCANVSLVVLFMVVISFIVDFILK